MDREELRGKFTLSAFIRDIYFYKWFYREPRDIYDVIATTPPD